MKGGHVLHDTDSNQEYVLRKVGNILNMESTNVSRDMRY